VVKSKMVSRPFSGKRINLRKVRPEFGGGKSMDADKREACLSI